MNTLSGGADSGYPCWNSLINVLSSSSLLSQSIVYSMASALCKSWAEGGATAGIKQDIFYSTPTFVAGYGRAQLKNLHLAISLELLK